MGFTIDNSFFNRLKKGESFVLAIPDYCYEGTIRFELIAGVQDFFSCFIVNIIALRREL